jgi:hypothetical protein
MISDDSFDSAWDRLADADEPTPATPTEGAAGEAPGGGGDQLVDPGPPIRVTMVLAADKVPVAPWAQGWRVGAIGPVEGHVTMLFEHDVSDSPVAQLAAITGLLGTIKQARLEVAWWAIQSRAPIPGEEPEAPSLDEQLSDFLISSDEQREAAGEDEAEDADEPQ